MSKCKIIYTNGQRSGVTEIGSNNPSQTFQDILNDVHIKNFDEALQIYKNLYSENIEFITERVADKLPLTLSVFERPEFVKLQGKQVNPVTIITSLNQSGIKQIEKDLIRQVIEDNYQGQNKVNYDELEATVRANIMPLEKIETNLDSKTRMENLGNYGEAVTLSFFSPVKHGLYPQHGITNKEGSFGHIRKWIKGEIYHLIEVQSDIFQKSNVRDYIDRVISGEYIEEKREQDNIPFSIKVLQQDIESLENMLNIDIFKNSYNKIKDDIKLKNKELVELNKPKNNLSKISKRDLTNYEKQFVAYQKEFSKRLLRESIKDTVLTGKRVLRFPTVKTAETIQGYLVTSVRNRYEEIAEILKKERGEENVEIVTDENGFDWYEAPITQEDTQSPVVAFSLSQSDPTLKYQTEEGNIYTSYSEALRNTNGSEVKIGVNSVEGFQEIYSKSTNTNIDTQDGLINHLIKAGILSDKSYKENGKTHLIPEGKNFAKKRINAENIKDVFQKQLGVKSAKIKADSSIELNEDLQRSKVTVTAKNGEQVTVDTNELNAPFSELKKKFDTQTIAMALASDALQKEMSKKTEVTPTELVPENELQEKLINLLNKFGIKMLSIETYLKEYSKRNDLPPTARALADIANKIVAFKDGIIENDDLVEETAHLIVASIPEAQKENLKRNIHKTKEWGEYAKQYEGVYATENELREEILGKVVANAIKEKFAQRESNQTENAIIAKIKELFDAFINNIKSFFQDSFQVELDKLNNDIFNNLFAETLDLNLESTQGVFFSTVDASLDSKRLVKVTEEALDYIRLQQNQLNKKYKDSSDSTYIEQSKRLVAMEEQAFILDGVAKFSRLVSSQTNRLVTSANKKQEGEFPLTAEENLIYQNLKNNVRGAISEIEQLLKGDEITQKRIREDLEKTKKNLDVLEAKVRANTRPAIERMTQNIMDRFDMTEKEREEYKTIIESAINGSLKDTDFMHSMLGSMLQARNPLLNLAGNITKRMTQQTTADFQASWKNLVNKLSGLGWSNSDFKKIVDVDTNTIIHEIDPREVKKWEDTQKAIIFKSLGIEGFDTLESYLESDAPQEQKDVVQDAFYNQWSEVSMSRLEPYYEEEFTKRRKDHKFFINGKEVIPNKEAEKRDKEYKKQIGEIRKNAVNDVLSKEDTEKIKEINLRRAEEANPRDITTGDYIKGVTEVYDTDKKRYFVIRTEETDLSDQEKIRAQVVVGLNQISYKTQDFLKGEGDKQFPQKFIKDISDLNTIEEKLEFLKNNAYVSYSDEYYQQMSTKDTMIDKLRGLGTKQADDLINDIRKQKAVIENIKKANTIKNEPGEIDVLTITDTQRNSIIIAESILESYRKVARDLLKEVEMESFDAVTTPTDSYFAHVEGMTLEEELAFIKKNTTPKGEDKLLDAIRIAKKEKAIPTYLKNIFSKSMSEQESNEALLKYARTLLLPHLKKTQPLDYMENFAKVKSGKLSVEAWIQGNSVKVTPSFGFYEIDSNINPKWKANKEAGKEQWKESYLKQVKDSRFEAIKKDKKLYDGWKAIMEYQDYQIENNNLTGVQSRYTLPGVRRTNTQRALSLTPKGVAETFKELGTYRAEEQELGAQLNNGLYTIPVYYNKPLDDPKEQTTDYLWALAVYGQAATQHKYRRENISDMLILDDALSNVKENSKNAYKMFDSFLKYNFYGKQENFSYKIGGVDLGKVLKTVNNFAKKTNLAGISIPIVSAFQATVAKNMERVIGETIDFTSANTGNSVFAKYASSSARESMGFESKSVPNVIGEAFGLYGISHRYENSQLSKAGRLFVNLSSKLHEMGNFPVVQRAMFGIIASYRYVDGKIMHYNKFRQKLELEGFKGNIQSEWKKQPEFINDFILAVKDGVLDLNNPEFLKVVTPKLTNIPKGKTIEDYLEDRKLDIGTRVLAFINRVDSQIPNDERSVAQRDARWNFFLSHLGWLTTAITRKVKQKHFNLSEDGAQQEGNWRTAGNFVANIIKNPKNLVKIYGELDFGQKKNLRRTMVELGYANALALLGLVLSQMSDDEDDNVLYDFASYFLTKTTAETISGTIGLPTSIMGVVDNPMMLATKMKQWAKVTDLAGDSEEQWKYIKSYSGFLRDFDKFSDLKKTRQSYSYFQIEKKNLYDIYAPLTLLYSKNEE